MVRGLLLLRRPRLLLLTHPRPEETNVVVIVALLPAVGNTTKEVVPKLQLLAMVRLPTKNL